MRYFWAILVAAAVALWWAYPGTPSAPPETFGQYAQRLCAVEEPNNQKECYDRKLIEKSFTTFQADRNARIDAVKRSSGF